MKKIVFLILSLILTVTSLYAQQELVEYDEPYEGYCITIYNLAFGLDNHGCLTDPHCHMANNITNDSITDILILGQIIDKNNRTVPLYWCAGHNGVKQNSRLSDDQFILGRGFGIPIAPSIKYTMKTDGYLCWIKTREVKYVCITEFYVTYTSGKVYKLKGYPKTAPIRHLQ